MQGVRPVLHHPRELGIDEVYVRRAFRPRWERGHRRDREAVSEAVAEAYLRRTETERLSENAVRVRRNTTRRGAVAQRGGNKISVTYVSAQ